MLEPIPVEVVVAYAIFSNLLYFQSKHAQNFLGSSRGAQTALMACSTLGFFYLTFFHCYTFWKFKWYYPLIIIGIGYLSFNVFLWALKFNQNIKYYYSLLGLILIPASGIVMGKIFFIQ